MTSWFARFFPGSNPLVVAPLIFECTSGGMGTTDDCLRRGTVAGGEPAGLDCELGGGFLAAAGCRIAGGGVAAG